MNSLAQILALSGHSEGGPIFFLSLLSLFGAWSQEALLGEEGSGLSKPNKYRAGECEAIDPTNDLREAV